MKSASSRKTTIDVSGIVRHFDSRRAAPQETSARAAVSIWCTLDSEWPDGGGERLKVVLGQEATFSERQCLAWSDPLEGLDPSEHPSLPPHLKCRADLGRIHKYVKRVQSLQSIRPKSEAWSDESTPQPSNPSDQYPSTCNFRTLVAKSFL